MWCCAWIFYFGLSGIVMHSNESADDEPFEVLRLFVFDDGTIGALEVVLPDESTMKFTELADTISVSSPFYCEFGIAV